MLVSLLLVLGPVGTATLGQLLLKSGMMSVGRLGAGALQQPVQTVLAIASTPVVWLGLVCYGFGAVLWLAVLSRLDLGYAYPLLAVSYILIPLLAHFLLGEAIPPLRWVGIAVIFIGVVIVARTA
ncbi:MAG: EamA family transporter [Anaerolineae bacterium]|nr:MAG: EamA family transporter [Anaerolineae bacterium]